MQYSTSGRALVPTPISYYAYIIAIISFVLHGIYPVSNVRKQVLGVFSKFS